MFENNGYKHVYSPVTLADNPPEAKGHHLYKLCRACVPNDTCQVKKLIGLLVLEKIFKVFTIYGHGGHLGHAI